MPNLPLGFTLVFLSWAVVATTLWGIGHLVSRGLDRWLSLDDPSDFLWLGLAALLAALQLWHLFLPVDWRASLVFVAIGGVGAGLGLVRRPRSAWLRVAPAIGFLLTSLPLCLLIANQALDAPGNFDSGMYHFQAIRWSNEYPIVPGLGNLNIQPTFNESFFLFVAWLNVFPFFNQGFHIANSFLLAAALLPIVAAGVQLLWRPRRPKPDELLALLMLPVLLKQVGSYDLHSPSPDLAVLVLSFVLFHRFVGLLARASQNRGHADASLLVLAALSGLLVTFKLSAVALVATALVIAGVIVRRRRSITGPKGQRRFGAQVSSAFFLLLPLLLWTVRGLVQSGYPAFPLSVGAAPVDWRVPIEATTYTAFYVRNHPRLQAAPQSSRETLERGWDLAIKGQGVSGAEQIVALEKVVSGWRWVGPWGARVWADPAVRMTVWVLLSGAVLALLSRLRGARNSRAGPLEPAWRSLVLLLPPLVAVLFWLWSAPAPRFGTPFLWLLALCAWVIVISRLQNLVTTALAATLLIGAIVSVCLSSFALEPVVWLKSVEASGFRPVPAAPIKEVSSRSGVVINVPWRDRRCWDTPLPSSPYVDPALELRDSAKGLAGGFRASR